MWTNQCVKIIIIINAILSNRCVQVLIDDKKKAHLYIADVTILEKYLRCWILPLKRSILFPSVQ